MKITSILGQQSLGSIGSSSPASDRLARAKAAMTNQPMPEAQPDEKESIELGEVPTSATQRIKMQTNRTVHRDGDLPQAPAPAPQQVAPQVIVIPTPAAPAPAPAVPQQAAPVPPPVQPPAPVAQTTQPQAQVGVSDTPIEAQSVPGDTRPISPELAELAKSKRALQVKERELLEKEKAIQAQLDGYIKIDDLKSNMLGTLHKRGFDQQQLYSQLTDEILGQKTQPDFNQLKEEILKSIDERLAGKDSQQEEAVYAYMADNVERMARTNIGYRLIRETKSEGKVMDLVKRSWKENGEILTEEEAMDLIEGELRDEAKRYAGLLNGEEKTAEIQLETEEPPVAQEQRGFKTLTNKDSARPAMNRRQRAIAAMLGHK